MPADTAAGQGVGERRYRAGVVVLKRRRGVGPEDGKHVLGLRESRNRACADGRAARAVGERPRSARWILLAVNLAVARRDDIDLREAAARSRLPVIELPQNRRP